MLRELAPTEARPDLPEITGAEAAAMARAVVNLFARWQLTEAEARALLGGMTARTYQRWKAGQMGRIGRDLATRLSLLMGIHKGLAYLFKSRERGYAWIKKPNADFAGRSPLDVMQDGTVFALERVRRYLDAERGGW